MVNNVDSQWKEAMIGEKTERSDAPTSQFLEGRTLRPLSFWKVGALRPLKNWKVGALRPFSF